MMFAWNVAMTTGVLEIDDQHRELIGKFNELVEAEANEVDRQKVGEILDFLQHYAEWHFNHEEQIMEKYHCHILEENKKAHNEYRVRFGEIYTHWKNKTDSDTTVLHDTIVELARWIVHHTLTVDNQLHEYIK
jgi:hemerythrin